MLHRIGHIAMWRYIRRVHPLADRLSLRWGRAARLLRWPLPAMAPYRRRRLDVVRPMALGDVLMCTPALREVKRLNPACRVTFYTGAAYQDLAASCPFVNAVRPVNDAPPDAVWMFYESAMRGPSASPTGRCLPTAPIGGSSSRAARWPASSAIDLGVNVEDIRPSCPVNPAEVDRFRRAWEDLPRPWVLVIREAGEFTRNKDWPAEYWEALLDRMLARCTIIEAGTSCREDRRPRPGPPTSTWSAAPRCRDSRRRSPPPTVHVAPITGSVHIAAAVGTPSVVIYGGYEHPDATAYPGNINLYSPVECAPCWLRTPCPHGKKCLHQITPDQVEAAVNRLWQGVADRTRAGRPSPTRSARDPRPPGSDRAPAQQHRTPRVPENRRRWSRPPSSDP